MKTITAKLIITITIILLFQDVKAQYGWIESTVKGSKSTYRCTKNPYGNDAIYVNINYNLEDTLKVYPGYSLVDPSFLGFKTDIHDSFLTVINECISHDKLLSLAGRNENLHIGLDINQDGRILGVIFSLDTATIITTEDLYCLEVNVRKRFVFKPIRKVNVKLMGGFGITTNFKEILDGEIPHIRKMEEQQREKERLFGN